MTTLRHWDSLLSSSVQGPPGPSGTSEESVGDVEDIGEMQLKLALRNGAGASSFSDVYAINQVQVGTTASGKATLTPVHVEVGAAGKARLQATAPTDEGHLQVDPSTGRAYVYSGAAACELSLVRYTPPVLYHKAADASALAALAEHTVFEAPPYAVTITEIWFRPDANFLPPASPNTAEFSFTAYDSDGVVYGSGAGGSSPDIGNVDAFNKMSFVVSPAISVPADGFVTLSIAKEGTGFSVPAGTFALVWSIA